MDLLTYLTLCEPDNLVRVSEGTYSTRDHDSLRISNGKWYWFSRGFGGVTALDYLIRVRSLSYEEALGRIQERVRDGLSFPVPAEKKHKLELPPLVRDPERVRLYLRSRGIREAVLRYLETHALLFETADYHNALFPGYDRDGIIRYAAVRSTRGSFKGEVLGSDKRYGFCVPGEGDPYEVHLFESAVDLASFLSLRIGEARPGEGEAFLSLGGVSGRKTLPPALDQYLADHLSVRLVRLHLDNDLAGRAATGGIENILSGRMKVYDEPPGSGCKDINDELMRKVRRERGRDR